jgi:hypothetical protein
MFGSAGAGAADMLGSTGGGGKGAPGCGAGPAAGAIGVLEQPSSSAAKPPARQADKVSRFFALNLPVTTKTIPRFY